jgi:predicted peptidase
VEVVLWLEPVVPAAGARVVPGVVVTPAAGVVAAAGVVTTAGVVAAAGVVVAFPVTVAAQAVEPADWMVKVPDSAMAPALS